MAKMRRIVNSTYVTLDGVITDPQDWPSGAHDPAAVDIQTDLLSACDAVLMGRHTYDAFAAVWPTRSGDPYSDRINGMAKYVVSSALRNPTWENTQVIDADPLGKIALLKEELGMDIVQYGFGRLTRALMHRGLLDELRLWVHPFFRGNGGPEGLMYRAGQLARFELVDNRALANGIVILTYRSA